MTPRLTDDEAQALMDNLDPRIGDYVHGLQCSYRSLQRNFDKLLEANKLSTSTYRSLSATHEETLAELETAYQRINELEQLVRGYA